VFSALKLAQQEIGKVHIAADIGCHAFGTFEPFSMGHSILGYGMSLASRAGVSPMMQRRTLAIMGDGGFWHNGLLTGVQSALFNGDDAVLLIFKNGYTSATGTQEIISTPEDAKDAPATRAQQPRPHQPDHRVGAEGPGRAVDAHREHLRSGADARDADRRLHQRLQRPEGDHRRGRMPAGTPAPHQAVDRQSLLKKGERVVRVKYGVDEDVCNGDHACIRLSGCPTLTIKDNPDPLKVDPVATVIDGCVGCGLCGANAHAATLCPSFYRAEVVQNPKWHERLLQLLPQRRRPRAATGMKNQPITLLICALGGEGGGVLTEWLVDIALHAGYAAQATSIPGVAQRTGATTYYLEVFPVPIAELGGKRPVFSLNPVPGALDAMVSSELLETARQIGNGMTSPDRTLVITSSARTLTTQERMQMGDGRADAPTC
jgi:ferredoxin